MRGDSPQQRIRRRIALWCAEHRRALTAYSLSSLVHLCLLLVLAALLLHAEIRKADSTAINSRFAEPAEDPEPLAFVAVEDHRPSANDPGDNSLKRSTTTPVTGLTRAPAERPATRPTLEFPQPATPAATSDDDEPRRRRAAPSAWDNLKDHFSGRTPKMRTELVRTHGGTKASEAAVAAGLQWLVAHQQKDGSWSFDHTTAECGSSCTGPGMLRDCEIGATAMALLCFLGAGETHQEGNFQQEVAAGLDFLLKELKWVPKENRVDLRDGSLTTGGMYVQGMASMVLSEAYAMTHDRRLREPAQGAVNFIAWAQDPHGGGWRYQPQSSGDTSVVGWQAMALISARVAELDVPQTAIHKALQFLRSVESSSPVGYGYMNRRARPSTTAIGFLCRIYLQPRATRRSFAPGARVIGGFGPSRDDMYYNYYATQFMHHYGGREWDTWNKAMRDWLVVTQETSGHAAGSWRQTDRHGRPGGRLYMTTMAIMTLEVYYRHLPLYQHATTLTKN